MTPTAPFKHLSLLPCFTWFWASAWLGGEASGRFGGLHGLQLLAGFGVGLASSQGGVAKLVVPGFSWGWGRMGIYALTGALVCGDLRDNCGDFSLGGWRFWDCVEFWYFMLNSSPIPLNKEKTNKSNNDDILTLL